MRVPRSPYVCLRAWARSGGCQSCDRKTSNLTPVRGREYPCNNYAQEGPEGVLLEGYLAAPPLAHRAVREGD